MLLTLIWRAAVGSQWVGSSSRGRCDREMGSKEHDVFLDVLARLSDEVALSPSGLAHLLLKEKLIPKTMWQNVLTGPANL